MFYNMFVKKHIFFLCNNKIKYSTFVALIKIFCFKLNLCKQYSAPH